MKVVPVAFEIRPFRENPQVIATLPQLWRAQLGGTWFPEITTAEVQTWYEEELQGSGPLPLTLLALEGDRVVGMCSLREDDDIRPDLVPWLASLVVDPECQGRGIGGMLVEAIQAQAAALGFAEVHLYTFDRTLPVYYGRFGWEKIGMDVFREQPVTLMRRTL